MSKILPLTIVDFSVNSKTKRAKLMREKLI